MCRQNSIEFDEVIVECVELVRYLSRIVDFRQIFHVKTTKKIDFSSAFENVQENE